MEQLPGPGLRIVLFEVGEKGSVRQVLEARSVIRHDVQVSREVVGEVAVTVISLMLAGVVAEVGRGAITGHRALVDAGDGLEAAQRTAAKTLTCPLAPSHQC